FTIPLGQVSQWEAIALKMLYCESVRAQHRQELLPVIPSPMACPFITCPPARLVGRNRNTNLPALPQPSGPLLQCGVIVFNVLKYVKGTHQVPIAAPIRVMLGQDTLTSPS